MAARPEPQGTGRCAGWLVVAAVVLVAGAACTTVHVSGGASAASSVDSWNPKLPICTQLSAALPGDPALAQNYRSTGTERAAGGAAVAIASVRCYSLAGAGVVVDIFGSSAYDPATMSQYEPPRPYQDGKIHDGPSRAQEQFAIETRGLTAAGPTEAYGSISAGRCTATEVKQNVLVTVIFQANGTTAQERQANCHEAGAPALASVMQRIG